MNLADLGTGERCSFCGGHVIEGFGGYQLADGRAFCGATVCAPEPRPDGAWRIGDRFTPDAARFDGGWLWWWWRHTLTPDERLILQYDGDPTIARAVHVSLELGDGQQIPFRADVLARVVVTVETDRDRGLYGDPHPPVRVVALKDHQHVDVLATEPPAGVRWRQRHPGLPWWQHENDFRDRNLRSLRPPAFEQRSSR